MNDILLLACLAALGGAVGIAAVLLADRVTDFFTFYRRQFSRNAEIEMADMFIFANGKQLFILNLMLLVLVPLFLHALFQILILTVGGTLVALFVPRLVLKQMNKTRLKKFEEQLPDAFMMLSSSLQSGASLDRDPKRLRGLPSRPRGGDRRGAPRGGLGLPQAPSRRPLRRPGAGLLPEEIGRAHV